MRPTLGEKFGVAPGVSPGFQKAAKAAAAFSRGRKPMEPDSYTPPSREGRGSPHPRASTRPLSPAGPASSAS